MPRITETNNSQSNVERLNEQEAISKAIFKVKRLRDRYLSGDKEFDTDEPMWRLYEKTWGIWWQIDDYKHFDSCEEYIKRTLKKENKKKDLKTEEPFYFSQNGLRINRTDEDPK